MIICQLYILYTMHINIPKHPNTSSWCTCLNQVTCSCIKHTDTTVTVFCSTPKFCNYKNIYNFSLFYNVSYDSCCMCANFLSSSSILKNVPYSLEIALTFTLCNDAVTQNLRLFVWALFIILLLYIYITQHW